MVMNFSSILIRAVIIIPSFPKTHYLSRI